MTLPPRDPNTMSEAIAGSSPSGRMSKRARKAFERRIHDALFGTEPYDLKGETSQPSMRVQLLAHAALLRDLAARGMSTRKFNREADRIEKQAQAQS